MPTEASIASEVRTFFLDNLRNYTSRLDGNTEQVASDLAENIFFTPVGESTGINGFDKLLAKFKPKGLQRGEYTLKIALTDPATGSQQLNSIPFFVN